jgi:uncharacterized protein YjbJ (UPF0337 family)
VDKSFTGRLIESFASGHELPAQRLTISGRFAMNQDTIKGQWKQISGKMKQQWGKLTDDDLKIVEGNVDMLAGRLQERYGMAREEAERRIRGFEENLQMSRPKPGHLKH